MNEKKDNIDSLFKKFENQWDIYDPAENNAVRFLTKQSRKKSTKRYWYPISIAASVLIIVGYFSFYTTDDSTKDLAFASKETQQTDSIFTSVIQMELEKVKEKKSPLNEKIVCDALIQMKELDADYEKLKAELIKNGENKQLIYAMIRNLQTRITFLENVLAQIDATQKLNTTTDEKTI